MSSTSSKSNCYHTYTIIPARSPAHFRCAATLFRDYATWIDLDLSFQNFSDEVQDLPGRYDVKKGGELLLAVVRVSAGQEGWEVGRREGEGEGNDDEGIVEVPLGCVALRALEVGVDEGEEEEEVEDGVGIVGLAAEESNKTSISASITKCESLEKPRGPPRRRKPICEMKRLYVSPKARGFGVGEALIDAILQAARDRAYAEMRLDTLRSKMQSAMKLYKKKGFREIEAYYETPLEENTVFLGLQL